VLDALDRVHLRRPLGKEAGFNLGVPLWELRRFAMQAAIDRVMQTCGMMVDLMPMCRRPRLGRRFPIS
jgi:hypothetical protein